MPSPLTSPVRVTPWPDTVIDRVGHQPDSAYFEWLWLPRIGPSAAWAYRRLTSGLAGQPEGFTISLEELAHWLGLGRGTGANSVVVRTLGRLVRFHLGMQVGASTLALRRRVPPLTKGQLAALSPHLQRTHRHLMADHGYRPASESADRRARSRTHRGPPLAWAYALVDRDLPLPRREVFSLQHRPACPTSTTGANCCHERDPRR